MYNHERNKLVSQIADEILSNPSIRSNLKEVLIEMGKKADLHMKANSLEDAQEQKKRTDQIMKELETAHQAILKIRSFFDI